MLRCYPFPSLLCFILIPVLIYGRPDASSASSSSKKLPHIVIIQTEAVYKDFGLYNDVPITPTIDDLARRGVILDRFYSASGSTTSRSMMLTCKHMLDMGLTGGVVRPDRKYGMPLGIPTLAEQLKEQEYATHYLGKWHLGHYQVPYTPTYRGFNTFYGYYNGLLEMNNQSLPCPTNISDWGYDMWDNEGENLRPVRPQDMVGIYQTHLVRNRALRLIDRHDTSQPFFMVVSTHETLSYGGFVPDIYTHLYDDHANEMELLLRQRFAKATVLDDMVADLVEALKFNGMWENTLFMFTSDKGGEPIPRPNMIVLQLQRVSPPTFLTETSHRTITFFHSPGLLGDRQGEHVREPVHVSDLFPTLMHVAGLPHAEDEDGCYGMNMWPAIRDGTPGTRTTLLLNLQMGIDLAPGPPLYHDTFNTRINAAYMDGDMKVVTGFIKDVDKNYQLINVTADPTEQHDLSDLPEYNSILRAMLDVLQDYYVNAPPSLHNSPGHGQDPTACPRHHGGYFAPWL